SETSRFTQMPFAVRMQMPACFRYRHIQSYRSYRILQATTLAHVHVDIATGEKRQLVLVAEQLEPVQMLLVGSFVKQLHGDTDLRPELFAQPAGLIVQRLFPRRPQNEALLQGCRDNILAPQGVRTFLGCTAPAGDEAAQGAIAAPVDGQ